METVTRQVELDISPEALWNTITDGDTLAAWLGDAVDVDLRPGGTGVVIDEHVTRHLTVDTVEPGRGWSFDWSVDDEPASHVVVRDRIDRRRWQPADDHRDTHRIGERRPRASAGICARCSCGRARWRPRSLR